MKFIVAVFALVALSNRVTAVGVTRVPMPVINSATVAAEVVQNDVVKRQTCGVPKLLDGPGVDQSVKAHNSHRSQEGATNEFKLIWNEDLAMRAQEWADQCIWEHGMTKDCNDQQMGQNMYFAAGSDGYPDINIDNIVKMWTDEKGNYHFDDKTCDVGKMCGHYTQVVWANTKEVGCGVAQCPTAAEGDDLEKFKNAVLFVCDYSPAGNYVNQPPFNMGEPCSDCSKQIGGHSGWLCENELCRLCTPGADGDNCNCDNNQDKCENGGTFNADLCTCDCSSDYFGSYCENKCECADAIGKEGACKQWLDAGFCTNPLYQSFMADTCPLSCSTCNLPESCNSA